MAIYFLYNNRINNQVARAVNVSKSRKIYHRLRERNEREGKEQKIRRIKGEIDRNSDKEDEKLAKNQSNGQKER